MTGRLLPGTAATKGSMLRSGPSVPICPSSLRCSGESCLTLKHSPDPATPVLVDLERPLRARAGSTRLLGSLPPGPALPPAGFLDALAGSPGSKPWPPRRAPPTPVLPPQVEIISSRSSPGATLLASFPRPSPRPQVTFPPTSSPGLHSESAVGYLACPPTHLCGWRLTHSSLSTT